MQTIEEITNIAANLTTPAQFASFQFSLFRDLTDFHVQNCEPYRRIVESIFPGYESSDKMEDLPFVPIGIFKQMDLISVPKSNIVRTLHSSGTSGETSKIFLDKITAINQIKVLTHIFNKTVSSKKLPLVVVDFDKPKIPGEAINARSAAVKGFSTFASEVHYILDNALEIEFEKISQLAGEHGNSEILFFGFTYMIWKNLLEELNKKNLKMNFPNAILVHGGGWKNLQAFEISNEIFKNQVEDRLGIKRVKNYYGMAEQTGSLYFECSESFLHTTLFGYIIIRKYLDFSVAKIGEEGIVQLLSVIPYSYPGHSILTEDVGVICGEDDCKCGMKGRYFKILGRLPEAEVRGCSDAYGNE